MKNFKIQTKRNALVDKIPVNNNFYFDSRNITLCTINTKLQLMQQGVVEISIPFELKSYLI